MERSTIDLWVGLFMVAGLGALTILALKVGNMGSLGSNETYQLSADNWYVSLLPRLPMLPTLSASIVSAPSPATINKPTQRSIVERSIRPPET